MLTTSLPFKVADISLATAGRHQIRLAEHEMPGLMALRELLARFDIGLGDVGFAGRLRREHELHDAVEAWFEAEARRPEGVASAADWLRWEQDKHQRLLAHVTTTEKTAA